MVQGIVLHLCIPRLQQSTESWVRLIGAHFSSSGYI